MTREITKHRGGGRLDELIRVEALGEPESGGAHAEYRLVLEVGGSHPVTKIKFQSGPVDEGFNGLTNESLLAIVADRLDCFQRGPYECRHNENALRAVQEALVWLKLRTEERAKRGVEGKLKV